MLFMYFKTTLVAAFCFCIHTQSKAYEPTEVDGTVSVKVDRSTSVWNVVVTNTSDEVLTYEMMGTVPRGLGIETWNGDDGLRVHAEDLAKFLDVDGFPADLRKLKPKTSVTFPLNPKSMSSADAKKLEKWKEIEKKSYYSCRVFFGVYSSRLFYVSPKK